MKTRLLKEAISNGHSMIRMSTSHYECLCCEAKIREAIPMTNRWEATKTGTLCQGARVKLTPAAVNQADFHM